MFARVSSESPSVYVLGGSKLPEWVVTGDELDDLRDAIDIVRPRRQSAEVEGPHPEHLS